MTSKEDTNLDVTAAFAATTLKGAEKDEVVSTVVQAEASRNAEIVQKMNKHLANPMDMIYAMMVCSLVQVFRCCVLNTNASGDWYFSSIVTHF
jgi:hypothetical protein